MKPTLVAIAAATLGVVGIDRLAAQADPAALQAVASAVRDVRDAIWTGERLPSGPVVFDPRVVTTRQVTHPAHASPITVREFGPARAPDASLDLLRELSAAPANLDSVQVCPGRDLHGCYLADNAVAAFAASDPVLCGDTAEVIVKALWVSNIPRQPIQFGTFLVVLTRSGTGWQVATRRVLTIS